MELVTRKERLLKCVQEAIANATMLRDKPINTENVKLENEFQLDLGFDSLEMAAFTGYISESTGIDIPEGEMMSSLNYVGDVVTYLENHYLE